MMKSLPALLLTLPGLLGAVVIEFELTNSSDVDLAVGGNVVGEGNYNPAVSGSMFAELDITGSTLNGIDLLSGTYSIADDVYVTSGGFVGNTVTSSGLAFQVEGGLDNLTVSLNSGDLYNLTGQLVLTMNTGTLDFSGGVVADFSDPFFTTTATFNLAANSSLIFDGTEVSDITIRLEEQRIVDEVVGPLSATLDVSSLNTLEFTPVPEPAMAVLAFGVALAALTVRRARN